MILYEVYFDVLGGFGVLIVVLVVGLECDFGSVVNWKCEFIVMGKVLGGGFGWVLLVWLVWFGCLVN